MNKKLIFHNNNFISALIFLISFITYLFTLAPTISWGDSGELITVAYTLGIAHPSGYPLYTLFGKLFTFIPIGSIAFRVNLMSAFFASLTVMLIYFNVTKIIKNKINALFSALILAFSFVFWSQAVRAEVYALNAFFFSIILFFLLKWDETKNVNYLYIMSFVYGLSFTNHLITVIMIIPIMFFLFTSKNNIKFKISKKIFNIKFLILALLLFILGFLPYIYLPIRSVQNPAIDWGNPENLDNFVKHVTGFQYRRHMFSNPQIFSKFSESMYFLVLQFTFFIGFAIIGIWFLWKKNRKLVLFFLLIILCNFLITLNYDINDIIVYYIPMYAIISIFIGIGLGEIIQIFIPKYKTILIFIIPIIILVISAYFYHERIYNHNDYQAYNYASYIFNVLPQNSIIITETDDELFPLWYMQYVKNKRNDIVIISSRMLPSFWYLNMLYKQYPDLILEDYNTMISNFLKRNRLSNVELMNTTFITELLIQQQVAKIIRSNNETYHAFDIIANISEIYNYNISIIEEIK